jgi:hypothetical protein
MYPLDPPLSDTWMFGNDFPDTFEIEGHTFHRAIRQQPYEGVICQYREAVPRDSMHLLVMNDGSYVIDHVDHYNPDMGAPVRHFLIDHPAGKPLLVAGVGILGVAGAAIFGKLEADQRGQATPDGRHSKEGG